MGRNESVTRRSFLGASAAAGVALAGRYLGSSPPGIEAAEAKAAPGVIAEAGGDQSGGQLAAAGAPEWLVVTP